MSNQAKETATNSPAPQDFKAPLFQGNKLVLYFHPYNFYSQKVSVNHVIFENLKNKTKLANWLFEMARNCKSNRSNCHLFSMIFT